MLTSKSPSPVLRGIASLFAIYGAFATHSLLLLGIALAVVVLVLTFQAWPDLPNCSM